MAPKLSTFWLRPPALTYLMWKLTVKVDVSHIELCTQEILFNVKFLKIFTLLLKTAHFLHSTWYVVKWQLTLFFAVRPAVTGRYVVWQTRWRPFLPLSGCSCPHPPFCYVTIISTVVPITIWYSILVHSGINPSFLMIHVLANQQFCRLDPFVCCFAMEEFRVMSTKKISNTGICYRAS